MVALTWDLLWCFYCVLPCGAQVREQRSTVDALLRTVKQLETRATQAEERARDADGAVADVQSALRSHLDQQYCRIQSGCICPCSSGCLATVCG